MAKLFVADSSQKSIENLNHFLVADGHEAYFFDNSKALSDILKEYKFDIIIVDQNYKGMPCVDIVNSFLKNPSHSNTHVIMTTSSPNKEDLNKFSSLGINHIFVKPYRYKLLSEKIKYAINPNKGDHGAFEPEILKIFLESTIHIFDSIGNIAIAAGRPFLKTGNDSLSEISAVIGLSSPQIKGSMSINLTKKLLASFLYKMLGPNAIADNLGISDMCGELCNQIMGRAKQQFLKKKGMSFEIAVPSVLSDPYHILDYKSSSPVLVIPFLYEKVACVFVEFCLEINDNYEPVEPEKLQVMIEEGELILF
ncbi:chemotaxis protein CheX [Silvanigrella sp.]|jgi:chemotaxis protein CheX|uniref:chemotaxis protein CheX n=1 Tax=Silvanigrella sp. TaxID=2024976 RepID=UPI0037C91670